MTYDLMGVRRWGPIDGSIRRILRNASMTSLLRMPRWFGGRYGLESVKKTNQIAGVGPPPGSLLQRPDGSTRHQLNRFRVQRDLNSTRLGYVIDGGPGNEAPRHAPCGAVRRGADRPDR